MVDIGLIVTGIKGTIATAKAAYELSKNMDNIQLKQAIMTLSEELLDVQSKVIELREEISDLREKVKKAEEFTGSEYKKVAGVIRKDGDEAAYCPNCFLQKKLIILSPVPAMAVHDMNASHLCLTCKGHYGNPPPKGDLGLPLAINISAPRY